MWKSFIFIKKDNFKKRKTMKKHRLDLEIKPKEIISKERLKGRK
jgi:hypothetical protein